MKKKGPTECSAQIDASGRVGCDCLRGMTEIRADIMLCHPRMLELIARAEKSKAGQQ
jgi:hypothetical protein